MLQCYWKRGTCFTSLACKLFLRYSDNKYFQKFVCECVCVGNIRHKNFQTKPNLSLEIVATSYYVSQTVSVLIAKLNWSRYYIRKKGSSKNLVINLIKPNLKIFCFLFFNSSNLNVSCLAVLINKALLTQATLQVLHLKNQD